MLPRVNIVRTDSTDYLLFSTNDAISQTVYNTGHWAKLIIEISAMFVRDIASPLVLDIGANLGAYAVPLAQDLAASGGSVYAYEPQRIIFYQLCGNAFLNRLDNLHLFQVALGRSIGAIEMSNVDYSASSNIGGFSLNETALTQGYAPPRAEGTYRVAMETLDSLVLPKAPSLIKIDVEGLELDVLDGGRNLLEASGYPPLLLEAWTADWFASERQALLRLIEDLGYACVALADEIIAQHPDHHRRFDFGITDDGTLSMVRSR